MKYKAVLFDLDGTLLDSVPTIMKCFHETFDAMGLPFDETAMRHSIGIPLKVQGQTFAQGRAQEYIDRYREAYLKRLEEDSHLFPGTIEALTRIKSRGHITGVVTSKSTRATLRAIELTGMTGMFDVIVTADDVEHYKPHPEPIFKAMRQLGVTSGESVYVGDSAFDIDMAQRADVKIAAVSWGARTHEELLLLCPDKIVDNWQELVSWLDGLEPTIAP